MDIFTTTITSSSSVLPTGFFWLRNGNFGQVQNSSNSVEFRMNGFVKMLLIRVRFLDFTGFGLIKELEIETFEKCLASCLDYLVVLGFMMFRFKNFWIFKSSGFLGIGKYLRFWGWVWYFGVWFGNTVSILQLPTTIATTYLYQMYHK